MRKLRTQINKTDLLNYYNIHKSYNKCAKYFNCSVDTIAQRLSLFGADVKTTELNIKNEDVLKNL